MTDSPIILAIDQGTGSTKCLLVDAAGEVIGRSQIPISQATPNPGWVEQDAEEIWTSIQQAIAAALPDDLTGNVASVGFSTQRESCVIWDRKTGKSLTPLLSWQDQRTASLCTELSAAGHAAVVREKSGLPLDPMFSAAKAKWLLDRIDPDRAKARNGDLCIGTIDAFILSRMGGEPIIEAGNASRTQLVDVEKAAFDAELLDIFDIPAAALPRIVPSVGPLPATRDLEPLPNGTPVGAVLGDSHAALFAHGALEPGPIKVTHGTGSSVMGLIGDDHSQGPGKLSAGVCKTLAWWVDKPQLAFEGNIRAAGSTLIWVAGLLGVEVAELAAMAKSVSDPGPVYLVPGFGGLSAPWWDGNAVATLSGFTLGTSRAVVARAALDSIVHQISDVVEAVRASDLPVDAIHVDGGPTRNDDLMQFEADMTETPVIRTLLAELSALGAAHLAGLTSGVFTVDQLKGLTRTERTFTPAIDATRRQAARDGWREAVARSLSRGRRKHKIGDECA